MSSGNQVCTELSDSPHKVFQCTLVFIPTALYVAPGCLEIGLSIVASRMCCSMSLTARLQSQLQSWGLQLCSGELRVWMRHSYVKLSGTNQNQRGGKEAVVGFVSNVKFLVFEMGCCYRWATMIMQVLLTGSWHASKVDVIFSNWKRAIILFKQSCPLSWIS